MSQKPDRKGWEVTCTQLYKTQWLHLSPRQKPHCVVRVLLQTGSDSSTERLNIFRFVYNWDKYEREKKTQRIIKTYFQEMLMNVDI